MARKKAPPAPPPPTRERVAQALRTGDYPGALDLARALHRQAESPENLEVLKTALIGAATHFADRNKVPEFNRAMDEADRLDPENAAWAAERACLLAKGGRLADALMRADDATRLRVLGHAADRALRMQSKDFLPDDLHAGFDAVLTAFRKYEVGQDAGAREALEPIGLRSPFLEWKVFLRGLLAYAVHDDARAVENFARLDMMRIPARLATPYRAAVDTVWKDSLPAPFASELHGQHGKLNSSPLVDKFREIARHLGRDKSLIPVFRAAESLVPQLKTQQPAIIPRLANCLYHAILQQGQPDDLPRYRKLFGNPSDDPSFFKLQALVAEHVGNTEMVHSFWKKFDEWLAAKPTGWSDALLARARATVWLRMGDNAERALEEAEADDDVIEPIFSLFDPPSRRKKKPKPLDPPMLECYRRAVELAPDWPDAVRDLYLTSLEAKKPAEAEAAVRKLLEFQPENLLALTSLAELLQEEGRAAEAAEHFLRATALNPLEKTWRRRAAYSVLAHARAILIASKKPNDCVALLEQHRDLLQDCIPAAGDALASVAAVKLGKPDEAAALRNRAVVFPALRLEAAYRIAVDSQLAKLKPAEKKAADAFFAEQLLAPSPTPMEVNKLLLAYDMYLAEGVAYRGQKTQEKKLLDQVARCLTAAAPEEDYEELGAMLHSREEWKHLKKLAEACMARFARNPTFLMYRCEVGVRSSERMYTIEQRLRKAKQLAEVSNEPRHRALIPQIDELLKTVAMPFDIFDSFFERPY